MNVFVSGANRGIGLEWTRQYLLRGATVFAGCRSPEDAHSLRSLPQNDGTLHVIALDVSDEASRSHAVKTVMEQANHLNVLINNAGIPHAGVWETSENFGTLTEAGVAHVLAVNAVGPLLLSQAFLPLLRVGAEENGPARLGFVSSYFGSVGGKKDAWMANNFAYSASKAALNLWARNLAVLLAQDNILTVSFDPGWVRTDMGGPHAHLSPEESVTGMLRVLDALTPET